MKTKDLIKKYLFTKPVNEKLLIALSKHIPLFEKLIPGNKMYSNSAQRKVKRDGIYFDLDISDYQEHLVYYNLDADSSRDILKHLPLKDSLVLDIGANIGQTTLCMASFLQNTKSTIISFEPFPSTFQKLENNVGLNNFTSIKIENMALGEKDSILDMAIDSYSNSGGYRVYNPKHHKGKKTQKVAVISLDKYLMGSSTKVDFIKIDVEGYEYHVLSGGVKTLKKQHPILFIELDDNNLRQQGHSAVELLELLDKLGYNSIVNASSNSPLTIKNFEKCHLDIVCRRTV